MWKRTGVALFCGLQQTYLRRKFYAQRNNKYPENKKAAKENFKNSKETALASEEKK